jgi:hypothetical protein
MWILRFVLDLPPAAPPASDLAEPGPLPPDLLAFDADAAFAEWSDRLAASPCLQNRPWGSAFVDDPWPAQLPAELHPAVHSALRERFSAQAPSVPRSLTWASRESRSHVRLEAHDAALALQITVAPQDPQPVAEATLPSDLAALLHPLPLLQEADLLAAAAPLYQEREADAQALLPARRALQQLGALWHDDLRLLDVLRLCADHPQPTVRASVIAVASQVGFRLFLFERAAAESDSLLLRVLRSVTAWPSPDPQEGDRA